MYSLMQLYIDHLKASEIKCLSNADTELALELNVPILKRLPIGL